MDIIERLNDPELYVDAVDDAIREIENLRQEKIALTAMLKVVEFDGSGCCPMCGGNQTHDGACVLAAFLYPDKAESYKRNTRSTHFEEMYWHIVNDEKFAFLLPQVAG